MRLSLHTDYGLRTLMYLAAREGHHSIAAIAQSYGISRNHLMKVAQRLAAEGYIESVRGRAGGLKLAVPADKLKVGAIVRKLEPMGGFVECFDPATNRCVVTPACGLRRALAGGVEAMLRYLDGFTVADLVSDKRRFRRLLEQAIQPAPVRKRP